MHQLTFEKLLTYDPFYHSAILAGWKGKRNYIHDVCWNDKISKNNSLLLLKYDDENTSKITNIIKNEQIIGVILYTDEEKYVSTPILELADSLNKPLLFLKTIEEKELYKRMEQIVQLQKIGLNEFSNDLSTYWLLLFYQTDIVRVIYRLSFFLGDEVYFFTKSKKFLSISPSDAPIFELDELRNVSKVSHRLTDKLSEGYVNNEKYYLFEIVNFNEKTIGYFLFKSNEFITDTTVHLLITVTPTIITWDAQVVLSRNVHQKYKDQFLFDLLNNNIETETELYQLGKMWDIIFYPDLSVVAIDIESSQPITKEIQLTIQQLLAEMNNLSMNIHTTYISHRVVAILIPEKNNKIEKRELIKWAESVKEAVEDRLSMVEIIIGIGRAYTSPLSIYKSFQEAKIALQMYEYVQQTKGVIHYDDIGFVRLLSYIHDDLLDDFAQQKLIKLEMYDREQQTDYVNTLYVYCNNDGDIVKSADNLYIHQNTLRQRLRKIESILGIQLNRYSDLVNIIIALKIKKDMKI